MIKKLLNKLKLTSGPKKDLKSKFTEIHEKNLFHGVDSISGTGSDLFQTRIISKEIPVLLKKYNINLFIDAPCGDLHWMQYVNLGTNYIGLDIVEVIIEKNKNRFTDNNRKFEVKNIVSDILPDGDLIMIRDCWVHLSNEDVIKCILNLKRSKIKYLLTTTFFELSKNDELTQIWRPINLQLPPFNFPKPVESIIEGCTENNGKFHDKSLMLWEIKDLPNYSI